MVRKLQEYRQKRDFARTPEPAGDEPTASGKRLRFVIQKHDATKLHYDLRLELEGVLKSWAVPKEPLMEQGMRRLAVQTEDHPLEYATFEGEIPKPGYGAGTVVIWDQGTWIPAGEHPARAIAMGKVDFELRGERLSGRWTLVRVGQRSLKTARKDNWLLIKRNDAKSPVQRSRSKVAKVNPASLMGAIEATTFEDVGFQLATATETVPSGDDWIHEPKLDGYRLLCHVDNGKATLITRNGHDWTDRFSHIADAASELPCTFAVLDGEAVVFDSAGISHFQKLQHAIAERASSISFVAFDILYIDGWDVRNAPLLERKRLLESLISEVSGDVIRYGDHMIGHGPAFLTEACHLGLEGAISKRAIDPYEAGRNGSWLKAKCRSEQEFVIVGFTDPKGARPGLGALLMGTYGADGRLRYAGRVGTGFDRSTLAKLTSQLSGIETPDSPLSTIPAGQHGEGVHWVKPVLVAEVAFAGLTNDGLVRQGSFRGLREEKAPEEVRLEMTKIRPNSPRKSRPVQISSPEKVLFPDIGVTKLELVEYWRQMADLALPFIGRRPLSLLRCPDGADETCFFQKHIAEGFPESVSRVRVDDDGDPYAMVENVDGFVGLTQMNTIEIHTWGSRADNLDRPDMLVFDLDPSEELNWRTVTSAAIELKERLEQLGLVPFAKLTGGKGIHVVVPVESGPTWPAVKKFTRALVKEMESEQSSLYTTSMSKAKRNGKIFLDYLRNDREATSIAPYSPRARAGAPVAMPVEWTDIENPGKSALKVRLPDAAGWIESRKRDPWERFESARRSLGG